MPFQTGEQMGPYKILEQLGQGGMATVYKAYHANLDRHVAIKVLHPAFKEDESFFIRFKREAQIVARLEHPNIVPVYDFSETGEPYIVMKYIEGDTLKNRIRRKTLTLRETLKIMSAVASALNYAHKQGVLHRDVKPSNVMIDKEDQPYLADFGLARIATSGESTMSQDVLIGTPHYISPEQARGVKNLGPETDVYSMAIMIYEIVVGRVPFTADTPYTIVHDHIYKPLPSPSEVNPSVPVPVEQVLLRALSKDPADRYRSTIDMTEAFKKAVEESDMSELSIATMQPEKFEETGLQSHSTEDGKLNDYLRNVTAEIASLKSQLANQTVSPVPAPIISAPTISSATLKRRRAARRRNFWILSGLVALIFICIASLGIIINALRDPTLTRQYQAEAAATPTLYPTLDADYAISMSVEEAQAFVAREPQNATAHLTLALAYFQNREYHQAEQTMLYVLQELNPSAELIGQAAAIVANLGYGDQATYLWFSAYHIDPENKIVRNDAGQYIYRQFSGLLPGELVMSESLLEIYPDSPFVKAMIAQFIIASDEPMTQARRAEVEDLLQQALEENDSLAEAHLVYGNYYAEINQKQQALASWRYARSFADTPDWVMREVSVLIQANEE